MSIQLLSDRCIVKLDKTPYPGRIFIPAGVERNPGEMWRGEVVQVGPGLRQKRGSLRPMDVKPGDKVLLYWGSCEFEVTEWPEEGYRVVRESDILAVIS